jgi:hypothetical protein
MGPAGWTKQPSNHSAFGPRTCSRGRRTRSARAVAVSDSSTLAARRMAAFWVSVKSLHFFLLAISSG